MKILYFIAFIALVALASCKKNDYTKTEPDLIKQWSVNVTSENENHPTNRTTSLAIGTFTLKLYSDSSIAFDVWIKDYQDRITGAALQSGNPIEDNGAVVVNLTPRVSGGYVSGQVRNIGASAFDKLMRDSAIYVNILSDNNLTGMSRGQLDSKLVYSQRVSLAGNNVIPPVTTATTGTAYLRATENKAFFYKVDIYNDEPGDNINDAWIYYSSTGLHFQQLIVNVPKKVMLNNSDFETLINSNLYVLGLSPNYPEGAGGKIRGLIR